MKWLKAIVLKDIPAGYGTSKIGRGAIVWVAKSQNRSESVYIYYKYMRINNLSQQESPEYLQLLQIQGKYIVHNNTNEVLDWYQESWDKTTKL